MSIQTASIIPASKTSPRSKPVAETPIDLPIQENSGQKSEMRDADAAAAATRNSNVESQLAAALKNIWGYDSFRPLQLQAMQAVVSGRDSLVVFPTGGGKSLCYQAPAVCLHEPGHAQGKEPLKTGPVVVVSPLISLMKDQVDALQKCGVRAACLNSAISRDAERRVVNRIRADELDLLYLAPERLLTDATHRMLQSVGVSFFAIDEAHCVSQWGHDFRPEYRGLSILKQKYPETAIHAYTATATEKVRADIIGQLGLAEPEILIGSMDRPNLNYQLRPRSGGFDQIPGVIRQHEHESGIIYCISRKEVESTAAALVGLGFSARPYHAGMTADDRRRNQEMFLCEEAKIIVATVAFGMGIDKSNVRYVIHASMPKSMEAYQQESGRAGRDGLPADCWMFHSRGDVVAWKRMIEKSVHTNAQASELESLHAISNFCNGVTCRHHSLAAHFGESLEFKNGVYECSACDVCLDQLPTVDDPLTLGQKIVSCVHRVQERFGAGYVAQVLCGSRDDRIVRNRHDAISTHGLLADSTRRVIRDWIEQLVGQDFLAKEGEYNVLKITKSGLQLLDGKLTPRLTRPPSRKDPDAREKTCKTSSGKDGCSETSTTPSKSACAAMPFFDQGLSIAEVGQKMGRAESTTFGYLSEYIRFKGITDPTPWVDVDTIARVSAAVENVGRDVPLKEIFVELNEEIDYGQIRIVVECLNTEAG